MSATGAVDMDVAARIQIMTANMGNTAAGTTTKNTDTATINDINIGTITGINIGGMIGATTMSKRTTQTLKDMAGTNTGTNPDIAIKTITRPIGSGLIQVANTASQVSAPDVGDIMDGAVSAVVGVDSAGCAEKVTSDLKNPVN